MKMYIDTLVEYNIQARAEANKETKINFIEAQLINSQRYWNKIEEKSIPLVTVPSLAPFVVQKQQQQVAVQD